MRSQTREVVDGYWAEALGCSRETLRSDGVSLVSGDAGDSGAVEVVRHGDAAVVTADPDRLSTVRAALDGLAVADVVDRGVLTERFAGDDTGLEADELLGPAFLGYADESTLATVETPTRVLAEDDRSAYETLRAACPSDEWEAGGTSLHPGRTVGRFVDGDLVALAGYEAWDETLAHVAVVTHPAHRNAGHAQAVVSAVARRALEADLVPQYRTLDAWPWSVQVAESLGFERWGTSVFVRLT
jgi:GNAT superfamily N-acetyltransferase